ncbi:MAG: glycosyltransferase [Planctomycetota bacterium]
MTGPRPTGTPVVLLAGGGTVGHLAPGFALAEALEARGVRCLFSTPGEEQEARWFEGRPAPLTVPAERLPRRPWHLPGFLLRLRRHARVARDVVRACGARYVVALGGWPCVPVVLAARRLRIPYGFVVPDAVPGLVVRRFRRRADRFWVAAPEAATRLGPRALVVGALLRRDVLDAPRDASVFGLAADRATLLVTGGSQGATAVNRWVLGGLRAALDADPSLAGRIQVLHATGTAGEAEARDAYTSLGLAHHVTPFLAKMGQAYALADLVVGRAGAGTCAELSAWRLPAVLVPYPHHRDRQQHRNAQALVEAGQAVVVEQEHLDAAAFVRHVLEPLRAATGQPRERRRPPDGAARAAADLFDRMT